MSVNPFFAPFLTPEATPPFSQISDRHYREAIERGIALADEEIKAIAENPEPPTFANTIEALEASGADLDRVLSVFYPLLSARATDAMMQTSVDMAGPLSHHSTSVILNERLWRRVKAVWEQRDALGLDPEQMMLLTTTYESFALNGADLQGADRELYRRLSARLAELTTIFGQNVLKEMNSIEVWLSASDLDGLPQAKIDEAAHAAAEKGRAGEYLFTMHAPSYVPFMKYSTRRDLRERMYRTYMSRNTSGEFSNVEVLREIAATRARIARLLGSPDHATQRLKRSMAGSPEAVLDLLDRLRVAYLPAWEREKEEIMTLIDREADPSFTLMPWDISFYSNLLRSKKYAFNEEQLRPYFPLEAVKKGVFGLAERLYGLTFEPAPDIETYHPEVEVMRVLDADGSFLGVLFTDFFPRADKRPGAWMTSFADQWHDPDGTDHRPVVTLVMNFNRPAADGSSPALLTPDEVSTFLHEFGHALHGLLAATRYRSLSGTAVYRDFVELPSQFNENFLTERDFLDGFARHYLTGEPVPPALIDSMIAARRFGAAYACLRQLSFGYLDMAWHTLKAAEETADTPAIPPFVPADAETFEREAMRSVAMFPDVDGAMMSPQFGHIFSGGYAAGYYSYKWAEVLDADAFSVFRREGIFNRDTATRFRRNILSRGGTENPAELYRRFRGQDPTVDALLRRDGIISDQPADAAAVS